MKNNSVIEKPESRTTSRKSLVVQPFSCTSTLRVTRTTPAIVVPIMPAMSSAGLPTSGMLGINPSTTVAGSGFTRKAVMKKAKPIIVTNIARTFKKKPCRPCQ